jgi:hypothetical protein
VLTAFGAGLSFPSLRSKVFKCRERGKLQLGIVEEIVQRRSRSHLAPDDQQLHLRENVGRIRKGVRAPARPHQRRGPDIVIHRSRLGRSCIAVAGTVAVLAGVGSAFALQGLPPGE